jgi:hypothetical protein
MPLTPSKLTPLEAKLTAAMRIPASDPPKGYDPYVRDPVDKSVNAAEADRIAWRDTFIGGACGRGGNPSLPKQPPPPPTLGPRFIRSDD